MKFPFLKTLAIAWLACSVPAGAEDLWSPKVGDRWIYEVVVAAPRGAELPKGDGIKVREGPDGPEATYLQTREFLGKTPAGAEDVLYDAIATKRGDVVQKIDFLEITPTAVYARGSKNEGDGPGAYFILGSPLLMVSSLSSPGDEWKVDSDAAPGARKDPAKRFVRDFRFFGKEKIKVPAGEYEALKIQITGKNGATEIRRDLWFQPGLGLVKEETSYYNEETLLARQTAELASFRPTEK